MNRDDLRVQRQDRRWEYRHVSDAELAELIESMGYVKAAEATMIWNDSIAREAGYVPREWISIPVDGIDVEALRLVLYRIRTGSKAHREDLALEHLLIQVLADFHAAIDQENTP